MKSSNLVLPALAAMLSGCGGDPAKEEPIKLQPGLYQVSLSGPIPMQGPGSSAEKGKICIRTLSEDTPKLLLRPMMTLHPACASPKYERTGNAVTASVSCPIEPDKGVGKASTEFAGTVTADGVSGKMNIKFDVTTRDEADQARMDQASAMMQAVSLNLSASRVGDCGK